MLSGGRGLGAQGQGRWSRGTGTELALLGLAGCTPHWQAAALKEVEGRRASSESPVTPGKAREHPLGSAAAGDTVAVGSEGVVVGHGAGWSTVTAAGCRVRGRLDTGVSAASGDGGEECVCGAGHRHRGPHVSSWSLRSHF